MVFSGQICRKKWVSVNYDGKLYVAVLQSNHFLNRGKVDLRFLLTA